MHKKGTVAGKNPKKQRYMTGKGKAKSTSKSKGMGSGY